eukprot:TRINITY_DN8586_c0_g2_i1.p1 TRINITY_DN8586_c0_g2~~TRINITY_DN8586_c0_g2_i1.p1  ORF type:complete len:152 (+),score=13.81 TRINITY_DN8586_c0_g2_i1:389-844(+)
MSQLAELCDALKDQPFTVLLFPCDQFGQQSPGGPKQIDDFVRKYFGVSSESWALFEKVHVNGPETHPVYHFLRHHAPGMGRENKMSLIGWNFGKFLVDSNGCVVSYFGAKTEPKNMEAEINAVIAGSRKGSQCRPTLMASDAPRGFGSTKL